MANPVHSLHLESQLEDSSPASDHWKHPPILYGEEQQRTDALHTEGVVERWCPLDGYSAVIHDDTALDKMEHLPTLAGMHTRPPSSPSRHPPSPSRVKANATKSADPVPLSSPQHPPKPPVAKSASNVSTVTAATTTTESSNPPLIPSSSTAQPPSVPLPNPPSPSIAKSSDPTTTTAEPPKDAAAEPSKDAAADPPKDGAADPPKDAAADPPKDATVEPIKDAATEPPKDAATEPPKDAATDKDATVEPPTGAATESSKVAEAAMTDAELPKDEATDNNATAEPPTDAVPPSTAPADTAMTDAELPKDEATDNSATAEPPNDAFPSPTAPADAAMTDAAQSPPPKAAAAPTTPEKVLSEAAPSVASSSLFQPCYELSDQQFNHLRLEEDRIRLIRASLSSHRLNQQKKKTDAKKSKRKRDSSSDVCKVQGIPGWRASEPKELNPEQEAEWKYAMAHAKETVERWVEHYRLCRESYWDERELLLSSSEKKEPLPRSGMYFPEDPKEQLRCCQLCTAKPKGDKHWDVHTPNKGRRRLIGDDLMQCLECSFVGCAPQSISRDSRQHMLQHLLVSGHKFGK